MRQSRLMALGVMGLSFAMGTARARAAEPVTVSATVRFAFQAGDESFSAGLYELSFEQDDVVGIRNPGGGSSKRVPFVTRLAARRGDRKPSLVFDRADGKSYLSEIHIPGMDGYALRGAPGKHTHETVEEGAPQLTGTARARAAEPVTVSATVRFAFQAGDESFSAGLYELSFDQDDVVGIRNPGGGSSKRVPLMARLAARRGDQQPSLVFDRTDGKSYLSEIHIPGMDGYALRGAPGKHTHETVQEGTR